MSRLFSKLLEVRGLSEDFLSPKYEELSDPFLLPDMNKAVKRLRRAADKREKVLIYGDYDVDGVTASAIMAEILEKIGVPEVEVMLPDRFVDGYGMSERLVERAVSEGFSLVVTVDCGSNNAEIIAKLANSGVDVVVTDHHELSGAAPEAAIAVVNPKRDDKGGLRNLCGAGVAFFLARAMVLLGLIPEGQEKWLLDLAAIGTICDAMELTGDNRIICYFGLIVLGKTRRAGLSELIRKTESRKLDTEVIGFQIGPRLNAAGRMKSADLALELLTTSSKTEAARLAEELNELNKERKKQQNEAISGVTATGVGAEPVVVVSGEWHEGILGIIAGQITEKYRRPTFVLTEVADGFKGSGRSFGDFNLAEALEAVSEVLTSGGGHAEACGLTVKQGKLEDFKQKINDYYRSLGLKDQEKYLLSKEDLAISEMTELSIEFLDELSSLEPFGNGNSEPVFLLSGMTVMEVTAMGVDGKHLRIVIRDRLGKVLKLVGFYAQEGWFKTPIGERADIWVNLVKNQWNGADSVEGRILRVEPVSDV